MIWFWVVVLVVIIGASAVVIAGRGDAMTDVYEDRPDVTVDRGPLTAEDLDKIRFTTAVRGYRMDEVDAFVERLKAELASRSGAEPLGEETPEDDARAVAAPGGIVETDPRQTVDQPVAQPGESRPVETTADGEDASTRTSRPSR